MFFGAGRCVELDSQWATVMKALTAFQRSRSAHLAFHLQEPLFVRNHFAQIAAYVFAAFLFFVFLFFYRYALNVVNMQVVVLSRVEFDVFLLFEQLVEPLLGI